MHMSADQVLKWWLAKAVFTKQVSQAGARHPQISQTMLFQGQKFGRLDLRLFQVDEVMLICSQEHNNVTTW